ncbi:MAG: RNA methyltransferase [Acidimicrobiia bacterium]|nr:RNA methyltransferase [Acidimicrobiia bacterium]
MARRPTHQLFVQCLPGLERLVESELRALGLRTGRRMRGGVEADATTRQLYMVNRESRLATRVLLRLDRFDADSFPALERGIARIDWAPFFDRQRVVVRASSTRSALYHTDAIAERVAGVVDRPDGPIDQRVHVRVHGDRVTVSLDTSGAALHHRGWRDQGAKAPLRPTMAAALLVLAGYDGSAPLIDPFCGSGTIAIEAARLGRDLPPSVDRGFAFEHWPSFEPGTWASVAAARSPRDAHTVHAADRDAGAVAIAAANADRAGVELEVAQRSVSETTNPGATTGWLVTNPPYGRRIAGGDRRDLFARLGQVARRELPGWQVALLAPDPAVVGHSGLALESRLRLDNGGIAVHLLVGRVDPTD